MTKKEDFPLILQAHHVADILCISRRKAYEVMEYKGFPLIRVGRAKRVGRDAFFQWIENQNEE